MPENFVSLHDQIRAPEDALRMLQEKEVVKTETVCEKCGAKLTNTSTRNGYVYFRCRPCGLDESIRKGTFLYAKHIAMKTFLLILYIFGHMPQLTIPQVIHEANLTEVDGRMVVGEGSGVSCRTIVEYFALFRDLIHDHMLALFGNKKIGGPGMTVEVDESQFGKRKYSKGKATGHRLSWVLGGICRETGEMFLVECPVIGGISRRTKVVLLRIIQEHVVVGTTILSDGWAAYRSLPSLGYPHFWVNHDLHYVDPETGVHTNRIESRWFAVKRQLPRGGSYKLESYLVLYLWKEWCKQQDREIFEELLKIISIKQREEDSEHSLAKVTTKSQGEQEISHDCFDCGKSFTNKPALQDHEQKCRSDFEFSCFNCGKGFNTQRGLNVHERSCSVHDCFDCGMEFKTKKELKKHMSTSHKK